MNDPFPRIEIRSHGAGLKILTLDQFFVHTRKIAHTILELYPDMDMHVWFDHGWRSGVDLGAISHEDRMSRLRSVSLKSVSNSELIPQALNFNLALQHNEENLKFLEPLLKDTIKALNAPITIRGLYDEDTKAVLGLKLIGARTGQFDVIVETVRSHLCCRIVLTDYENNLNELKPLIKIVADNTHSPIVIADTTSWYKKLNHELKEQLLYKRYDLAVGWRTLVRHKKVNDLLLKLSNSESFADGVLLSFGGNLSEANEADSRLSMEIVANMLIAEIPNPNE